MSIVLEDFTIKYDQFVAVDHLSVTITEGMTGLLGVNGAGKSSFIKGLLGLVPVADGRAMIWNKSIQKSGKVIRQLTGYMPEDDCLIPGLTGLQMVRFMGELCGMPRVDAIQRAHEILFEVGLGEARYRRVETFSVGMKQRIKLAQAVVHDPKLLLLDEPTSGMDPQGRMEMLDLIQEITERGKMSVVLATHILPDVERICKRVIIINRGKVMEDANINDLKGEMSNAYLIRVDGDTESFHKWLNQKGCHIQNEGKAEFDVTLPKNESIQLIFSGIQKTGTVVRKILPSIRTLEDVFVKRLKEEQHADL